MSDDLGMDEIRLNVSSIVDEMTRPLPWWPRHAFRTAAHVERLPEKGWVFGQPSNLQPWELPDRVMFRPRVVVRGGGPTALPEMGLPEPDDSESVRERKLELSLYWLEVYRHHLPREGWIHRRLWEEYELVRLERFGRALGLEEETDPRRKRNWINWELSDTARAYNVACGHLRAKGHSPDHGRHWGVTDDCCPDDPVTKKCKGSPKLGAASCADAIRTVHRFEELIPAVESLAAALPADKLLDLLEVLEQTDGLGALAVQLGARGSEGDARAGRSQRQNRWGQRQRRRAAARKKRAAAAPEERAKGLRWLEDNPTLGRTNAIAELKDHLGIGEARVIQLFKDDLPPANKPPRKK